MPVRAHDGVRGREPQPALLLGQVAELETDACRRPCLETARLAPRLPREDEERRRDLFPQRRERVEKDVPALVRPEETAEEEDGRVRRKAEMAARVVAVGQDGARLGRVRHDRDRRVRALAGDLARAARVLHGEAIRPAQDGAREGVLERDAIRGRRRCGRGGVGRRRAARRRESDRNRDTCGAKYDVHQGRITREISSNER